MSIASDLAAIEPRVAALVCNIASPALRDETHGELAQSCIRLLNAFSRQAVDSSAGGKRLRSLLALAAFDALATGDQLDSRSAMLDVACAIEVFQTAALVHDDIIDDSDLRRGNPSAHTALGHAAHSAAIGKGLGLMLGDLLATGSVTVVNDAAHDLPQMRGLLDAFLRMQHEVGIGQVLDLAVERTPLDDPVLLANSSLTVFRWKTASYTTIAPLELGMVAAGMTCAEARRHALEIGSPLGIAFQLADDLLDAEGPSAATGKPIGGDIREGKRTVLLADALSAASPAERRTLTTMYQAASRDGDDVDQAIDIFARTGSFDKSRERINQLLTTCLDMIAALPISVRGRDVLTEACKRFAPESSI